ncbi:MAG: HD domain-containing protein [Bacteroidetes bacterium]|nr:HD domain-containing protein [Bacteroidota bacterium]
MENNAGNITNEERLGRLLSSELLAGAEENIGRVFDLVEEHSRKEKKPELSGHLLEVADILVSELNLSDEPVLAVFLKLLFPEIINAVQIEKEYGKPVYEIVTGLQKIERMDTAKYRSNAENFIKLLLTISSDIRVILIALGQRLCDMRNILEFPEEKQKQLVGETSLLYIPLAHRIGLYRIKTELEDHVMRFCDPETYRLIGQKLKETQKDRDRYTSEFIRPIAERLKENGFVCEIRSRVKSIPSIHRKMISQKVEFEKVYDLFAIRIILENTVENEKADCWKIYSIITDIYTPNPRRLRDWISFPKSTGYESLHTTVIGTDGRWVEVQIRTRRMDDIAEKSFAAHWKYKAGEKTDGHTDFYASIREMLENPVPAKSEANISREKRELYRDEIFVFTPKGDLKKLKAGYTVLDFAWEVHTDIGATCTGAIVNGIMVPLKHVLKNGDTVKILTSKNQKPSHNWLEFVQSSRVQARIRHALKMEAYKDSDAGKEILRNKVTALGFDFTDIVINKLVDYFGCENYLDLYQRFGEGKLDPLKIKKALAQPEPAVQAGLPPKEESFPERISDVISGKKDFILIDKKINSIHYVFSRCCNPIPGDKIFAFVSVSQGIRIHKTNCPNAHDLISRYPYRVLEARWKAIETERSFTANLVVTGPFSKDIVSKLTQFLTNELKVSVRSTRLQTHPDNTYSCEIGILINNTVRLDEIIKKLQKLKEVQRVTRAGSASHSS